MAVSHRRAGASSGSFRTRAAGGPNAARSRGRRSRAPSSASSSQAARRVHGGAPEGSSGGGGAGDGRGQPAGHAGGRGAARARPLRERRRVSASSSASRATPRSRPQTLDGIRRYLGSGLIKGIGPEFAGRIVERFGIETLEILDERARAHRRGAGHRPRRAPKPIRAAWSAQRQVREVMVFLQGYGVSPAFAARIYKRYGAARDRARAREPLPPGLRRLGHRLPVGRQAGGRARHRRATSDVRVEAGVRHVLDEAGGAGHVFVPRARAGRSEAAALLEVDRGAGRRAPSTAWRAPASVALDAGRAATGRGRLRRRPLPRRARGGRRAARACSARHDAAPSRRRADARSPGTSSRPASRSRASRPRRCAPRCRAQGAWSSPAAPASARRPSCAASSRSSRRRGLRVALAAPTGRAAKRLTEATGQRAPTLHRLLECGPPRARSPATPTRPLERDLLVVDEASMLDVRLAADLLAALAPGDAPRAGGRRRSAPVGGAGHACCATSSPRARCPPCA